MYDEHVKKIVHKKKRATLEVVCTKGCIKENYYRKPDRSTGLIVAYFFYVKKPLKWQKVLEYIDDEELQ